MLTPETMYLLVITPSADAVTLGAYAAAEGAISVTAKERGDRRALVNYQGRDPVEPLPPGGTPDLWTHSCYIGDPARPDVQFMGTEGSDGPKEGLQEGSVLVRTKRLEIDDEKGSMGLVEGGFALLWPITDEASLIRAFGKDSAPYRAYELGKGKHSKLQEVRNLIDPAAYM